MDWSKLADGVMQQYDGAWQKAIADRRKSKATAPATEPAAPTDDSAEEGSEPDDSPKEEMDEATKAKLLELLSQ